MISNARNQVYYIVNLASLIANLAADSSTLCVNKFSAYPHFDHFTITCFSLYFGSSVLHKFLALCKYVFQLYIDTIKQHYASPGTGGVTHNTLEDIHNHWKRAEAVRIKCLGVPTLDMDNLCFHLEVEMQFWIPHQKLYMLLRHNNFHN